MTDFQFVTERLALGGAIENEKNMQFLARVGFTHVVNLQREFDDRSVVGDTGISVLWIACVDDFQPKPSEIFWDAAVFTLQALEQEGTKILFHCAAGVHRSPMILLAMLRMIGYGKDEAIQRIVNARPVAQFPEVYVNSAEAFFHEYQSYLDAHTRSKSNT